MRVTSIAAVCLVVAGCAKEEVKTVEAPPPPPLSRDDCYTVVLFDDPPVVQPDETVPVEHAKYLGSWTRGAWNGEWCTELFVTEVRPDGTVELYEMNAPHAEWSQPASAFKRTARIDQNGDLRFRYGTESLTYALVDGTLHAQRTGRLGKLKAVLVPPDAELPDETQVAAAAPAALAAQASPAPAPEVPAMATSAPAEPAVPADAPSADSLLDMLDQPDPAGLAPAAEPEAAPAAAAAVVAPASAG